MTAERSNETAGADHEYFRRLEEFFIQLRGAPLLLSPTDWEVARRWRRERIPLDLIYRVLETVFDRRAERRSRTGVRSLKYFDTAVEKAWRELKELGAAPGESLAQPLDIGARLAALATSLPDSLPEVATLRRRILGLGEDAEAVENALAEIDSELLEAAARLLSDEMKRAIEERVERTMRRLRDSISDADQAETARQLWRRQLRSALDLPILSLFSPDAAPELRGRGSPS